MFSALGALALQKKTRRYVGFYRESVLPCIGVLLASSNSDSCPQPATSAASAFCKGLLPRSTNRALMPAMSERKIRSRPYLDGGLVTQNCAHEKKMARALSCGGRADAFVTLPSWGLGGSKSQRGSRARRKSQQAQHSDLQSVAKLLKF